MTTEVNGDVRTIILTEKKEIIEVRKYLNEFCDSSTIHGLKYLGTRPLYEK